MEQSRLQAKWKLFTSILAAIAGPSHCDAKNSLLWACKERGVRQGAHRIHLVIQEFLLVSKTQRPGHCVAGWWMQNSTTIGEAKLLTSCGETLC